MLSPFDEIFILVPLSAIVGVWVFPLALVISLICLVVGAVLIGRHLMPLLSNPLVIASMVLTAIILIYMLYCSGWVDGFLKYM